MVVDVVDVGRNNLKISVAFVNGEFHIATMYRDHVLTLSESRCSGVVDTGMFVEDTLKRLKRLELNQNERDEINAIIARLKSKFDAEIHADVLGLQLARS